MKDECQPSRQPSDTNEGQTMPVKKRYSPAMRGITVAAIVAAVVTATGGTAQASHRHVAEGAGHHRVAAAIQPIGKCVADPDHIGGSTCEIATYAADDGVHVFLENYNDHPVKISTIYQDWDGAHSVGTQTTVTTRVPAHSQRSLVVAWIGLSGLYIQWVDEFNGRNLGSQILDRP